MTTVIEKFKTGYGPKGKVWEFAIRTTVSLGPTRCSLLT